MDHTERHKALLVGLVLGEVTDAETNEIGRLLETCAECRADLEHYQRVFGPDQEGSPSVQFGLVLSGWHEDVDAEIRRLLVSMPPAVLHHQIGLQSGATGDTEEAVILVTPPDAVQALLAAVRSFLAGRKGRRGETRLSVGVTTEPGPGGRVIRRESEVGEDKVRLDGLAGYVDAFE